MQSKHTSPCIPSKFKGRVSFKEQSVEIVPDQFVTGVTRDSDGAVLGFCRVALFLTKGDVFMGQTTSDVDGVYSFYSTPGAHYYVVSYLTGSPDVFGTTLNTLDGEIAVPVVPPPVVGIGTQTVTDTFTRANENPMVGNWTPSSTANFVIVSNAVTVDDFGPDDVTYYNAWASGDDQYSQVEVTVVGGGSGAGPGVCVRKATSAAITGYRLAVGADGTFELAKQITGSFTSLRTGSVSYVAGKKLGLSATGSSPVTLKIWYDGAQVGTDYSDASSPIATGSPGLFYSSTATSFTLDNWDAGTVP